MVKVPTEEGSQHRKVQSVDVSDAKVPKSSQKTCIQVRKVKVCSCYRLQTTDRSGQLIFVEMGKPFDMLEVSLLPVGDILWAVNRVLECLREGSANWISFLDSWNLHSQTPETAQAHRSRCLCAMVLHGRRASREGAGDPPVVADCLPLPLGISGLWCLSNLGRWASGVC